ncbi:MAG: Lpp/OprI family alanine-zipper lipoprotein [Methylomonas sp.]|jgi:murein lipoprotein
MNKTLNRPSILFIALLTSGCASTADVDALHTKIDALEKKLAVAGEDAATAKPAAARAESQAGAADASANRAAEYSQDTNKTLDEISKAARNK